jgi:hypothetical protein
MAEHLAAPYGEHGWNGVARSAASRTLPNISDDDAW